MAVRLGLDLFQDPKTKAAQCQTGPDIESSSPDCCCFTPTHLQLRAIWASNRAGVHVLWGGNKRKDPGPMRPRCRPGINRQRISVLLILISCKNQSWAAALYLAMHHCPKRHKKRLKTDQYEAPGGEQVGDGMKETNLGEIKVMRWNVCSVQKQRGWEETRKGEIKDSAECQV